MFELKTLSPEAVPRALAKAERYRLLNEPGEAQSICLDVLAADPDNQEAVRTIILALTDQFGTDISCVSDALTTVADLKDHVRARLLHGHRPRAARQGASRSRHAPRGGTRLRMAARSDAPLRGSRRHPPAEQ